VEIVAFLAIAALVLWAVRHRTRKNLRSLAAHQGHITRDMKAIADDFRKADRREKDAKRRARKAEAASGEEVDVMHVRRKK
jgi:hypothetical protein